MRLIARIWWLSAQRRWKQNVALLLIASVLSGLHGYHTLNLPDASPGLLTLLFAAALGVALFLSVQIRGENILASPRIALLPFAPRALFLLRPVFGNPLRVLLIVSALAWGLLGMVQLEAASQVIETLQLLGWILVGVAAIEIAEDVLRRRASLLVYGATVLGFAVAVTVLAGLQDYIPWAEALQQRLQGSGWQALLVGSTAPLKAEVGVVFILAGTSIMLLRTGQQLAERWERSGPPAESRGQFAGLLPRVARRVVPSAPASFTKELALTLRVVLLRINYLWIPVVVGIAFYGGVPFLFAAMFGYWIGLSYNLLGPDVPRGGLVRYQLLPAPLSRTLAYRHGAIVLVSVALAIGLILLAGAAGIWRLPASGPATRLAYPLWLLYGTSLFLLFVVTGDRISRRFPRRIAVRNLLEEGSPAGGWKEGVATLFAMGATAAIAALVLGVWSAVPFSSDSGTRLLVALPFAALTHGLIYRAHLRRRTPYG